MASFYFCHILFTGRCHLIQSHSWEGCYTKAHLPGSRMGLLGEAPCHRQASLVDCSLLHTGLSGILCRVSLNHPQIWSPQFSQITHLALEVGTQRQALPRSKTRSVTVVISVDQRWCTVASSTTWRWCLETSTERVSPGELAVPAVFQVLMPWHKSTLQAAPLPF